MSKTGGKAGISFVMPAKNEARTLESAVRSIVETNSVSPVEILISVDSSRDGTLSLAQSLAKKFDKGMVKVLTNDHGGTAQGLNLAISQSKHPLVLRVDAHSKLSEGYAALAQQIIGETGAANVGGMMVAEGEGDFQKAVAYGYNNRIGLGGGSFHVGGKAGPVDTVYLGCFQRAWLDKVGGYDPKWVRGQDWELNKRIREAGGTVWFDPRLKVTYFPRDNWLALAKQFFNTGIWRGALTREAPGQSAFRYWLPPLLVVSTLLWLPVTIYLLVIAFAAVNANELNPVSRLWLMIVLPTMHYAWGIGFWWGLIRGAK